MEVDNYEQTIHLLKEVLEDTEVKIPSATFENEVQYMANLLVKKKILVLKQLISDVERLKEKYQEELIRLTRENITKYLPIVINQLYGSDWRVIYVDNSIIIENPKIRIVPYLIKGHDGIKQYDKNRLKRYSVRGIRIYLVNYDGNLIMDQASTPNNTHHPNINSGAYTDFDGRRCYSICMGTMQSKPFNMENLGAFVQELHMLNLTSAYRRTEYLTDVYFNEGEWASVFGTGGD